MQISRSKLIEEAKATGFQPLMQEKVILLITLLNKFNADRYLSDRIVLKGGTALNLFVFRLPRLSVDIDLNYIGAADRDTMLKERPLIEKQILAICQQEGFKIKHEPSEHAGGKYLLGYQSAMGATQNLHVDLNFMYRVPLFAISRRDSCDVGSYQAQKIPILHDFELAGGKVAALIGRTASRDLFDTNQLNGLLDWKEPELRLALILYGAMQAKDWRTIKKGDIEIDLQEVKEKLIPVLRDWEKIKAKDFTEELLSSCTNLIESLLPLREEEVEFIRLLREEGEIKPELLTGDTELCSRITQHPALKWRAQKAGESEDMKPNKRKK